MHSPKLTPPRPLSQEPRPVGTRASSWLPRAADAPTGARGTWLLGGGALCLVALAVLFVAAPYRSARELGRALASGEVRQLEAVIDFPALRDDLKRQSAAAIDRDATAGSAGLRLAGAAFANATIDALVQPEMVAKLRDLPVDAALRARLDRALDRARLSYDGIDSFTIRLVLLDVADEPIKIRLGRAGVFAWKVQGLTLPADLSKLGELAGEEPAIPVALDGVALVD